MGRRTRQGSRAAHYSGTRERSRTRPRPRQFDEQFDPSLQEAKGGLMSSKTARQRDSRANERVLYKIAKVKGLDIFYREAGSPTNPTLLLLHGFPTSSRMFRNLIPQLADRYHLVAPDYPGFGAPVGYRLAVKHPERVQALIVQNGNAYEEGLRDFWTPIKAYWKDRSAQ